MKRDAILVVKIIVMLLLSLGIAWTILNSYYFTAGVLVLLLAGLAVSIWAGQRKAIKRMEQMISAIRYGDLNITFPNNGKGDEGELNRAMNEALSSFRDRMYRHIVTEAETEAWQKLIRVLTHEIMNSLAPIISLSETVTERVAEQGMTEENGKIMQEAMESIYRRSNGLLEFVENYRKLTRIPIPEKHSFPVHDLFDHIHRLLSDETTVHYTVSPSDMRLLADRTLMEQVLINLIKNALEATTSADNPEIRVEATLENGKTMIRVSDNGKGIVPEALDRIYVPFFTTKPGGSGIGLSLSRQIVNRHDGTISVDSEPGRGSTFTIRLP